MHFLTFDTCFQFLYRVIFFFFVVGVVVKKRGTCIKDLNIISDHILCFMLDILR